MRVDRAPYWKHGAIAVKVVQKGSLSRWSWNTQKCQGKLRNVRKVGVRAEKAREVNLGNEVQKGRQGPDHTGPSRLWWGLLILFSTGTVLSKGWTGHNLVYAKIPSGHYVGNELGVGSKWGAMARASTPPGQSKQEAGMPYSRVEVRAQ